MRTFVVLFTCVLVIGIVVFAVLQAPQPKKVEITVNRIDPASQPLPVLQSDPAAEHVLDLFPDAVEPTPGAGAAEPAAEAEGVDSATKPARVIKDLDNDTNRLMALIEDWVYVEFSQIGDSNKTGTIHKTRDNTFFNVFEGQTLENGVHVNQLTGDAVTLRLGEAVFPLRLALVPKFFDEVKENPRPLTPAEQEEAYNYYMRRFGDKFKKFSENYKPPFGTQMPRPVTQKEQEQGLKEYEERFGSQFMKESAQYNPGYPQTQEQKDAYKRYWAKFHPGKPMPDFDQLFTQQPQVGPGGRIVPDGANPKSQ
ncbi:MAG: hypothetical protein ACE15F_08280 [bacterium]